MRSLLAGAAASSAVACGSGSVTGGSSADAARSEEVSTAVDSGALDVTGSDVTVPSDAAAEASDATSEASSADGSARDSRVGEASDVSETGVQDTGVGDADASAVCPAATATGTVAVTYQIDIAHTGSQQGDTIVTPLCRRWSHDLGAPASYALVAGGRVFVTIGVRNGAIIALDQKTGATLWGPAPLGGTYTWTNAAYDNGHVFTINTSGTMQSLNEATGVPVWTVALPGQYAFSSPPTAGYGQVFVGGAGNGGTVYSVDEATGNVSWSASVANGDHSSPALSPANVYVSYACNQAYAFARGAGGLLWHYSGSCEGGGGKTVSLYQDKIYARDISTGNIILDANDGGTLGVFNAAYIPAFAAGVGYYVNAGILQAIPVGSATPSWTFGSSGDQVITAPIVVGAIVFTATASTLYALSVTDGSVVSSDALAGVLTPDEQNVSAPLAGLAAADGMLFVPAGNAIVAY